MARYNRSRRKNGIRIIRNALLVLIVPILITSVSYAILSQNLNISAKVERIPPTPAKLEVTYNRSIVKSGIMWQYVVDPITITNVGGSPTTNGWKLQFYIPLGSLETKCWGFTCSVIFNIVTVENIASNRVLAPGESRTIGISFKSWEKDYSNFRFSGIVK